MGVPRGLLWGRSLRWWHWCLATFLTPEEVEKTTHPPGNSEEKVLKSSSFLPKTRVEQRGINKIYPLN